MPKRRRQGFAILAARSEAEMVEEVKIMAHFHVNWIDWGDDYTPPPVSWRILKFIDDTQISLFGIDETLAELFAENRPANDETAEEIIKRLEAHNNYIPESARAHKDYAYLLLKEYKRYVKEQTDKDRQ